MTILDTIVEEKQREVARLPQRAVSVADLKAALEARGGRAGLCRRAAETETRPGRADC